MRGLAYNPGILPAEMIIRQRVKPMPSRDGIAKEKFFSISKSKQISECDVAQRRQAVSVYLIDKRRRGQQIPPVGIPNHTWFCVLDIDGMDALVDTRHYCDTATATPAKAKKMAALIENWTPPDGWCNGNDRDWHEKMKGYICDFLRKCNGFRVM